MSMPNIDFRFLYYSSLFLLLIVGWNVIWFLTGFMWLALWISECECIKIKHTPIQPSVCDETAIVVVTQDIHIHTHTHTQNECVGRFALEPVAITTASSSLHPAFVNASSHSPGKAHRNTRTLRDGGAALTDRSVFDHSNPETCSD